MACYSPAPFHRHHQCHHQLDYLLYFFSFFFRGSLGASVRV